VVLASTFQESVISAKCFEWSERYARKVMLLSPQSFWLYKTDTLIENSRIEGHRGSGVYLAQSYGVTIRNSVVRDNRGSGVAIGGGRATIEDSQIVNNYSSSNGGGIYVGRAMGGGFLVLRDSLVTGNSAGGTVGGIYVDPDEDLSSAELIRSTVEDNWPNDCVGAGCP
jgi:hypothetical protein